MSTKDLIERIRGEQKLQQDEYGRGLHVLDEAADALERLTQPAGVEPVSRVLTVYFSEETSNVINNALPCETFLYSAETVARLIAERSEAYNKGFSDGVSAMTKQTLDTEASDLAAEFSDHCDALQEQVKMLRDAAQSSLSKLATLPRNNFEGPTQAYDILHEVLAATEPKEKTE